jgi:hypothetical protein
MERYKNADCEKTQAPPTPFGLDQGEPINTYATKSCYGSAVAQPSDEYIVAELFRYHAPNLETIPKYAAINLAAKHFAELILQNCPRGKDRTRAIEKLRDARMLANASISLNGLSL